MCIVAMGAQVFCCFKTTQAIHTRAVPFVHGSGAIGLKTINPKPTVSEASCKANLDPLSTLRYPPWRSREQQRPVEQQGAQQQQLPEQGKGQCRCSWRSSQ
jgi:hypothetical protein